MTVNNKNTSEEYPGENALARSALGVLFGIAASSAYGLGCMIAVGISFPLGAVIAGASAMFGLYSLYLCASGIGEAATILESRSQTKESRSAIDSSQLECKF